MHRRRIRIDTDFHRKNTDSPQEIVAVCRHSSLYISSDVSFTFSLLLSGDGGAGASEDGDGGERQQYDGRRQVAHNNTACILIYL